jgi:hypothetical protein
MTATRADRNAVNGRDVGAVQTPSAAAPYSEGLTGGSALADGLSNSKTISAVCTAAEQRPRYLADLPNGGSSFRIDSFLRAFLCQYAMPIQLGNIRSTDEVANEYLASRPAATFTPRGQIIKA